MATVITTISDEEMGVRCIRAAAVLWENRAVVVLSPGIFRASEWTPAKVILRVAEELEYLELLRTTRIEEMWEEDEEYKPPVWRCWLTRRPDGTFILKASRS